MRALIAVTAMFVALASSPALADDDDDEAPVFQKLRFIERGERLFTSVSIAKLFDRAAYEALDSGFTSTVVVRMWVYPRDSTDPVAFMLIQRQVLYNLWDEVYELKFEDPGGRRVFKEKRKAEALKRLTNLDDIPIARLADLPIGDVFLLAMEVELNPVSKETLAQVRRWLSQGTGGGLDRGGAFFGSFVSVFVNPKIAEADRVLRIRSQPFFRPRS
ncbi:MAG: hypothetical protein SFX73_35575 [Kofleriaceae bacterium]|nr:hypothetical protein [Kofleriaceae bacterium]